MQEAGDKTVCNHLLASQLSTAWTLIPVIPWFFLQKRDLLQAEIFISKTSAVCQLSPFVHMMSGHRTTEAFLLEKTFRLDWMISGGTG